MYPKVHPVINRSKKQMLVRCRIGNIANFNKAFEGSLKYSFPEKADNLSDYNMLLKHNTTPDSPQVYLTRTEKDENACVVAPYLISKGSLRAMGSTFEDGRYLSNANLGDLVIDEDTTVGEFSRSLMTNNLKHHFEKGDEITFYCAMQTQQGGYPSADVYYYNLCLDATSNAKLWNIAGSYGFHNVGGHLGSAEGLPEGGCAGVCTRHHSNGT